MQWTIKKKLSLSFGFIALLLACWTAAVFFTQHMAAKTEQSVAETGQLIANIEYVHAYVLGVTTRQRAYLIGGDERNLAAIALLRQKAAPVLAGVAAQLSRDPDQNQRWNEVLATIKKRRGVVDALNQSRKTGGFEAAYKLFVSGEDDRLQEEMENEFASIKQASTQQLENEEQANQSLQNKIRYGFVLGLIFSFAILITIATSLIHSISLNVRISLEQLEAISHKDLAQERAIPASQDELADAIEAINNTREAMAHALSDVARAAQQVAAAGAEIEITSQEISSSTRTEQASVDHFASSLTEMNAATMTMAEHAESASLAANEAVSTAQEGQNVIRNTEVAMNRISETVHEASANITALGEVTSSIGEVVKIIQDIAGQTNLLALNAAIEAARAGEQGKGFAVVAQEVRQLAERTARFTGEIASKIESVQQGATRAVTSMQAGEQVVNEGIQQFQQVATALHSIAHKIEDAQQGIAMIATATTEQSAETSGLTESMNNISMEITLIAQKVEHSAQASAELSRQAAEMQQIVDGFKLPRHVR